MHKRGYITLLLALIVILSCHLHLSHSLDPRDTGTCSLKDNCNIEDTLLAVGVEKKSRDPTNLESKIVSVFEDKVNYSLKLFDNQAIVEYNTLDGNISSIMTNFTLAQLDAANAAKDGEEEEDENDVLDDEKDVMYTIGQKFISLAEPIDVSHSPEASEACRRHTRLYLEALNKFDLWALKMHDSTGKLNSGILNGNINQFGDFDQCLGVKHHLKTASTTSELGSDGATGKLSDDIKGQYCLAYAQPELPYKSKRLQTFFKLVQSHGPFRSEFNDPGHRVPRFSLINWGICIPSSCSYKDVEYTVKEYLNNVVNSTGITFKVRVEPQMCQVKDSKPWDNGTTWAVRFFMIIISITILSTIYHMCSKRKGSPWLVVFSLKKNLIWLFKTSSSSSEDISVVHGMRFLNAMMLLFAHKSMALFFNPYDNRTEMAESLGQPWTVVGRAASLYTDPFLMFSGMLTAYSFFGRLNKGQTIKLRSEYISRLIRIVPPLAALILFCTYILPMMGSGPQWNLVVGHHSHICKKHWWRNLLFIHNYFGFSNMCLTHTHHLGIDTQLFAVAPLMIFTLWKWPRKGAIALISLALLATAGRYYVTVVHELSNYVYFGTNIQRLFRTADRMYSFPPLRSTVYIMGIFLGYGLRKYQNIRLSKNQVRLGWIVAHAMLLVSLLGPAPMGALDYQYNTTHSAIYAAFVPITWCLYFCWVVVAAQNGYNNILTKLYSWRGFQVSTKLSYAIYLTQFPTYFYNVGRRRHVHHFYNIASVMLDTNEYISIFAASVVLTILFDAPFQNIRKILRKRPSAAKPSIASTADNTSQSATKVPNPEVTNSSAPLAATKHPHTD